VGIENTAGAGLCHGQTRIPFICFLSFYFSEAIPDQIRGYHAVSAHGGKLSDVGRGKSVGSSQDPKRYVDGMRFQSDFMSYIAKPMDKAAYNDGNPLIRLFNSGKDFFYFAFTPENSIPPVAVLNAFEYLFRSNPAVQVLS